MALEHQPPLAVDPAPTGPRTGRCTGPAPGSPDGPDAQRQHLLRQATTALRTQGAAGRDTALTGRVMRAVRAEHRRGRQLSRCDPAHGHHIDENTAAATLRRAADSAGTARAGSCRLTPTPDGRTIHATMTLTAGPSCTTHNTPWASPSHASTSPSTTSTPLRHPPAPTAMPCATTGNNESGPWTGPRIGLVTALAGVSGIRPCPVIGGNQR